MRSLFEPVDDGLQSLTIATSKVPYLLGQLSVCALHERGVQSPRWRFSLIGAQGVVEVLCFLLCHPIVEVAGRSHNDVLAMRLVHFLRQQSRVEHHRQQLALDARNALTFRQWLSAFHERGNALADKLPPTVGYNLFAAIVVVDAV